jgi:Do/DeqQ family serine protease
MKALKRSFFVLFFLTVVIFNLCSDGIAEETVAPLEMIQNSFHAVAQKVYPAVVSINTVYLSSQSNGMYYVPKKDPLFEGFFGESMGRSRNGAGFKMPDREFKKVGIGSGVIIDPSGYILTNHHVVEEAESGKVTVKLADGQEFEGVVKGSDPRYDIALVKINTSEALPTALLGDSSDVTIGDWAIAIGNPYAFAFDDASPTMTVGVVGALNRALPGWIGMNRSYTNLIQTDAAINAGNSGGPLVNIKGHVIGINVAIVSTTGANQGIGFAVPSNLCLDLIAEVIEGREVLYSWLGVSVQSLNYELASFFDFPNTNGVLVIKSLENSPAKVAGVRDGDIITFYNDKPVKKVDDLLEAINVTRVGEKITLTIFRNETEKELDIIMGSRPRESSKQSMNALNWRGIKVDNITYELARDLNISNLKGVVITDIQPDSPAEKAGLSVGEVITTINQLTIETLEEYYSIVYDFQNFEGDVLVKTLRGYFVLKQ